MRVLDLIRDGGTAPLSYPHKPLSMHALVKEPDRHGKRRMAFVIPSLDGGGAGRVMSEMANFCARRGFEIVLITLTKADVADFYAIDPAVSRVRLSLESTVSMKLGKIATNFWRVVKLRRTIKDVNADVVISFLDSTNVLTILATRGMGLRVVVSERINPEHNFLLDPFWQRARRYTYRYADHIVAQTRAAARYLEMSCRVNVTVISNPLRVLPHPVGNRERFILSVGRLSVQKGFDTLIQAFAEVHRVFPDWYLVILGDGPEKAPLAELVKTLSVADRVKFFGQVEDPTSWMDRAGLVVQASRFEGFPNALLEAMGMGAAVISTDCPSGPSEIIEDGINGRLVPVDNVEVLAKVIAELLVDDQRRRALGYAALGVRERFATPVIMKEWEKVIL